MSEYLRTRFKLPVASLIVSAGFLLLIPPLTLLAESLSDLPENAVESAALQGTLADVSSTPEASAQTSALPYQSSNVNPQAPSLTVTNGSTTPTQIHAAPAPTSSNINYYAGSSLTGSIQSNRVGVQ